MATLWIIDGYNFIRTSRGFAEWEAKDPAAGKKAALEWLGDFSERTGQGVCVIFDAYGGLHREMLDKSAHGIRVLESRGGYSADEEIIALARQKGAASVVVSSDKEIQREAIRAGSSILNSVEFEREVEKIFRAGPGEEEFTPRGPRKGMAFRPPKEKKKAFQILRKYQ